MNVCVKAELEIQNEEALNCLHAAVPTVRWRIEQAFVTCLFVLGPPDPELSLYSYYKQVRGWFKNYSITELSNWRYTSMYFAWLREKQNERMRES